MRTGDLAAAIPGRQITGVVPFDWDWAQDVQPIYEQRTETGYPEYFAGLSVNGSVFPITVSPLAVKLRGASYLSTAKVNDVFAGFRLRPESPHPAMPSPFLVMQLEPLRDPQLVATEVMNFAMLDGGSYVFVTKSSEVFWGSALEKATWSVLDGVARWSGLERGPRDEYFNDYALELQVKKRIGAPYTEGSLNTLLIDGFGNHDSLALCVFFNFSPSFFDLPRYKPWRSAIIVTSAGERYMTDLLREGDLPDFIEIHNSAKVITGKYLWGSLESNSERKVHLSETTLRLQP